VSTVFGPVPSRRLGRSLGVDPVPLKTCNWNCVYCQLGRTRRWCRERQEFIPPREILNDLEKALAEHPTGTIDWVTFVGGGEPTLHSGLGWLIRRAKERTRLPVAVITNGSLLSDPGVRDELFAADVLLPSLDAGTPNLHRRLNRPAPAFRFERQLEGLVRFCEQTPGRVWLEVMLVHGMNDTDAALHAIADCLDAIRPDEVHLMTPLRPAAEAWVRPPDAAAIERALSILGPRSRVPNAGCGQVQLQARGDLPAALLEVITRHPTREAELLTAIAGRRPDEVLEALKSLADEGRALTVSRDGDRFWRAG
jgi:wyosine [tRNA(Phe)-imidazoG37] synthetase (radical SAM superfamily)